MAKNTKNVPTYMLIIASLAGYSLKDALPQYQLLFLGIALIVSLYEVIKLKRTEKGNDKIYIMISSIIMVMLLALVVCGKNYLNMSEDNQLIILAIAFSEFMLTTIVFGFKIVNKSNDARRIR